MTDTSNAAHANALVIRARIEKFLADSKGADGERLVQGLDREALARLRSIRRRSCEFHILPRARRTAA